MTEAFPPAFSEPRTTQRSGLRWVFKTRLADAVFVASCPVQRLCVYPQGGDSLQTPASFAAIPSDKELFFGFLNRCEHMVFRHPLST